MAVLGDAINEGVLVAGGIRIRDFDEAEFDDFWPTERVFRRAAHSKKKKGVDAAVLSVSQGSISAIKKGHPWILSDKETGDPKQFQVGTLVRLEGPREGPEIAARISGSEPLVARVWKNPPSGEQFNETLEGRISEAFARRNRLHDDLRTTAYRVIHGEADGLPGLAVDRLGPVFRLLYSSRCLDLLHDRIIASLRAEGSRVLGAAPSLIEVIQLRNRPQGTLECVRLIEGDLPVEEHRPGFFRVTEAGLSYWVEPGLNETHRPRPGFGLFVDQRINRERVCKNAAGKAWLNLFCHTGAFSVALLRAGASRVVSVDLSRPYLHWLEENLELNGLKDSKHQSIKQDARRYLERLRPADNFDGIILDPPTAASSGRRFWSVKKEVGQLISLCLKSLKPGGELLVTRNDRRAQGKLEVILEEIAKTERIQLAYIKSAPPGPDFPRMKGFPEGDSFQGVLAKRV
jgi:23S rRNA (cytosine1962-C5)-methyltransferase